MEGDSLRAFRNAICCDCRCFCCDCCCDGCDGCACGCAGCGYCVVVVLVLVAIAVALLALQIVIVVLPIGWIALLCMREMTLFAATPTGLHFTA